MISTKVKEKVQAAMARNYAGRNLRGRSFKEQDLAGADFSGADIRGARFVDANLSGARFVGAKAGVQKRWLLTQLLSTFVLAVLLNFVSILLNALLLEEFFQSFTIGEITIVPGFFVLLCQLYCFYAIARQGLTSRALNSVLVAIVASVAGPIAITAVLTGAGATGGGVKGVVFSGVVSSIIFGPIVIAGAVAGAVAIVVTGIVTESAGIAGAVILAIAGILVFLVAFAGTIVLAGAIAGAVAGAVAGVSLILALYMARQVNRGDEKFALAQSLGLSICSLGGTTFAGADLTQANFSEASLKSTTFNRSRQQETVLTHCCWDNAKQLEKARLEQSILDDSRVRQLLTQRTGHNKSYQNADLHQAHLNGICLEKAQIHRANLNRATCRDADFSQAILTEAQAIGTDFTNANLTGACLENWNIDQTTIFEGVRCNYIFLREHPDARGSRERRPHNPDKNFEPGDFQKYFQEVLDNLQLLIRNGTSPEALRAAMRELEQQHGITPNDITKTERKGNDLMLTFEPQHRVDKAAVEATFDNTIAQQLAAAEEKGRLQGRVETLEQQNHTLNEALHLALAPRPISVNVNQNQGDNVVSETNNLNQNNSGGTNFQTKATDSKLNQAETLNIDSAPEPSQPSS